MNKPYPGSKEALAAGCKCPVEMNSRGKGFGPLPDDETKMTWMISTSCPIHWPVERNQFALVQEEIGKSGRVTIEDKGFVAWFAMKAYRPNGFSGKEKKRLSSLLSLMHKNGHLTRQRVPFGRDSWRWEYRLPSS